MTQKTSCEASTENQPYPFFMTPHGLPFLNSSLRIPDPDLTGSEKHRRGQKELSKIASKNEKKNGKKWKIKGKKIKRGK